MPPSVGCNAGKDRAGTQGAEKHRRTQGPLRQEARPTSSGSDAASKEASQVNRQRLTYQLELSREPQRVSQKCSFSIDLEDDQ